MQRQFFIGVIGAEFDLNVDATDVVGVRIGLTVGYFLEAIALRSEEEVDRHASIGCAVILLSIELDQRITVEVYRRVAFGFGGV
jgi:hypothetical protein